jgi:hypothetical protein
MASSLELKQFCSIACASTKAHGMFEATPSGRVKKGELEWRLGRQSCHLFSSGLNSRIKIFG